MSRKVPKIYAGNTVKKRDRQSFKTFVLEVIKDTFINEFAPTSSSLDASTQKLFTLFLGEKDGNDDGDLLDRVDIGGYRFNYEDLQVDNAYDYIDIYLYGVKQDKSKYNVKLFDGDGTELTSGQYASGSKEIRMIFDEDITRVPLDVPLDAFTIKGKIVEIE
jgi:hypothetical protein|tara:strand:+ start:1124 stop:1609 length:486 start_codon:yes stop_codon:yes gene_type:complete